MPDVNVLIYAHREESPEHEDYGRWLRSLAESREPFALSELVASSFIRIVTHAMAWKAPTPVDIAFDFVNALKGRANCVCITAGAASWQIFNTLCVQTKARGKIVADAYHAAIAIEHGCTFATNDGDFARFRGLRTCHPLHA